MSCFSLTVGRTILCYTRNRKNRVGDCQAGENIQELGGIWVIQWNDVLNPALPN